MKKQFAVGTYRSEQVENLERESFYFPASIVDNEDKARQQFYQLVRESEANHSIGRPYLYSFDGEKWEHLEGDEFDDLLHYNIGNVLQLVQEQNIKKSGLVHGWVYHFTIMDKQTEEPIWKSDIISDISPATIGDYLQDVGFEIGYKIHKTPFGGFDAGQTGKLRLDVGDKKYITLTSEPRYLEQDDLSNPHRVNLFNVQKALKSKEQKLQDELEYTSYVYADYDRLDVYEHVCNIGCGNCLAPGCTRAEEIDQEAEQLQEKMENLKQELEDIRQNRPEDRVVDAPSVLQSILPEGGDGFASYKRDLTDEEISKGVDKINLKEPLYLVSVREGVSHKEYITKGKPISEGDRKAVLYRVYTNGDDKQINVPHGVTTVANHAFVHCPQAEKVLFPESLSLLTQNAFAGCSNLRFVSVPENCRIENEAIPKNVKIDRQKFIPFSTKKEQAQGIDI